jgi:hypothetical protein
MPSDSARELFNACLHGDVAAVSRLLPSQSAADTSTALTGAATFGHMDVVRMILERTPDSAIDSREATHGGTALGAAAYFHHADILELLADRGAKVNLLGIQLDTPLHLAVGLIHPDEYPRDPDPDGARQVTTVKSLLRLGAGTKPLKAPLPRQHNFVV